MPASGSVLDEIVAGVREDLARREAALPLPELRARLADAPAAARPDAALPRGRGSSVIAEVKRRSPSKGDLADIPDPAALATAYARGRCRRDLGAHRGASLRRQPRRPAQPCAPRSTTPDPAQGLHRRELPARRGPRRRRRPRAADRRRARRRHPPPPARRGAASSDSPCWSRSTTRPRPSARWRSTPS